MQLSVVAPCYNEVDSVSELYRRVSQVCRDQVGDAYEIVLINDGSADGTWSAILSLTERDPHRVQI